jgi:hypothetical protein
MRGEPIGPADRGDRPGGTGCKAGHRRRAGRASHRGPMPLRRLPRGFRRGHRGGWAGTCNRRRPGSRPSPSSRAGAASRTRGSNNRASAPGPPSRSGGTSSRPGSLAFPCRSRTCRPRAGRSHPESSRDHRHYRRNSPFGEATSTRIRAFSPLIIVNAPGRSAGRSAAATNQVPIGLQSFT